MSKQNRVRASSTRVYESIVTRPCFHCRVQLAEKHFCYGCKAMICDGCDETGVEGNHVPGDHKRKS